MKIEQKLQMDVIKGERIYYAEFGDLTFVADGHVGAYLTASELKIDKTKMQQMTGSNVETFSPESLQAAGVAGRELRTAYNLPVKGFAIKLKAIEGNAECFVQEKFLKMFYGYTGMIIRGKKEPVFILKYGKPYGIIMPINIPTELE